jgi:hypothetical protein
MKENEIREACSLGYKHGRRALCDIESSVNYLLSTIPHGSPFPAARGLRELQKILTEIESRIDPCTDRPGGSPEDIIEDILAKYDGIELNSRLYQPEVPGDWSCPPPVEAKVYLTDTDFLLEDASSRSSSGEVSATTSSVSMDSISSCPSCYGMSGLSSNSGYDCTDYQSSSPSVVEEPGWVVGSYRILPTELGCREPTYSRNGETVTASWSFTSQIGKVQMLGNEPLCTAKIARTGENVKHSEERRFDYDEAAKTGTFYWSFSIPKNEVAALCFNANSGNHHDIFTATEAVKPGGTQGEKPYYQGNWILNYNPDTKENHWGAAFGGGTSVVTQITFSDPETGESQVFENLPSRTYIQEDRWHGRRFLASYDMKNTVTGESAHFEKMIDLTAMN